MLERSIDSHELSGRSRNRESDHFFLSIYSFADANTAKRVRVPVNHRAGFAVLVLGLKIQSRFPDTPSKSLFAKYQCRAFERLKIVRTSPESKVIFALLKGVFTLQWCVCLDVREWRIVAR